MSLPSTQKPSRSGAKKIAAAAPRTSTPAASIHGAAFVCARASSAGEKAKRIAAAAQPLLTPDGNTDAAVCARPSERSAAGSSAERNAFPRGGAAERCARRTRPVLCFFFIP